MATNKEVETVALNRNGEPVPIGSPPLALAYHLYVWVALMAPVAVRLTSPGAHKITFPAMGVGQEAGAGGGFCNRSGFVPPKPFKVRKQSPKILNKNALAASLFLEIGMNSVKILCINFSGPKSLCPAKIEKALT
jgi:hypothetical protein